MKGKYVLGKLAFIFGLIGLIGSIFPILNTLTIPLCIVAIVFGCIAKDSSVFVRARLGRLFGILGLVISVVIEIVTSIIIAIIK